MRPEEAALRERELYEALSRWDVPSTVVIGGYGASARSFPRFSHDLDLLIQSRDLAAAQATLHDAGLRRTKHNPVVEQNYGGAFEQWMGGRTRVTIELLVDSVQDRTFQVPLPYDALAGRADVLPLRGTTTSPLRLPVACNEALIAMKVQPMRPKDRGDICCLAAGAIDTKHLEGLMKPLAQRQADLLSDRLTSLADELTTEETAHRLLGPRIAGPPQRRQPVIRAARRLVRTMRAWL